MRCDHLVSRPAASSSFVHGTWWCFGGLAARVGVVVKTASSAAASTTRDADAHVISKCDFLLNTKKRARFLCSVVIVVGALLPRRTATRTPPPPLPRAERTPPTNNNHHLKPPRECVKVENNTEEKNVQKRRKCDAFFPLGQTKKKYNFL